MKTLAPLNFPFALGVASLVLLPLFDAAAQTTVATDPVGYAATALPANSDSLISIPFTRPVEYTGPIASVSGSTITLSGTPGFTSNQFVYAQGSQAKTYYAIIGPLLTNLANTVSVTNGSTTVTGSGFTPILAGDELLVNGLAYNVASVTSDTALVLSRAYTGTTASGLSASYDRSPKEGSYYTVTANSTGALTVNLNGDSLSTVAAGTTVSLIPYWTLGTAFPASDAGVSYVISTGLSSRTIKTQILLPDLTSAGFNLAPAAAYINYNGSWRLSPSDGTVAYDDVILPPTSNFTVRNAATATTFTPSGGVYMNRITAPLDTLASGAQDNAVSVPRPVTLTLNDLGLLESGAFALSTGTSNRTIKDTLLVYDNTQTGFNKAPSAAYFYYNGGWRLSPSDGSVDYGATPINYGTGFIVRKAPAVNGATSFWRNTRTY